MKEFFYLSADGRTQIRAACWEPPCAPRAVLQFVHGMYEHMGWYDRFARWLAFLIFIPVAPDDYLCFLAGTTAMRWQRFTAIILLCKPASIALYSLGLTMLFQQVLGLWR